MPGFVHADRKRGDQGMDALHYTERTGTASNGSRCACGRPGSSSAKVPSSQPAHPSIVESVPQLDVDFARVAPMKASEGLTVVEIHAAVRHIEGIQRCGETFAEVLAQREIERSVLRQMTSRI